MKRKTISFSLIFLLLFIQSIDFTTSQSDSRLTIEKYDFENEEWTKITLIDLDYLIESDNGFIDEIKGKLITDPWFAIINQVNDVDFFNLVFDDNNSTYNIRIEAEGEDNEIRYDTRTKRWTAEMALFFGFIDTIFDRITGSQVAGIWPIDISVGIAESYPEQFRIDVTLQRGWDMLTYTGAPTTNFALVASDLYDANNSFEPNWIFNASIVIRGNVSLTNSGDQILYSFPTFTFNTEIDFENLGFMVILESGTFLKSHPRKGDLPFIGSVDPLVYKDLDYFFPQTSTLIDSFPSVPAFLPFPWFMSIVPIVAIPIIRKRRN
jgi:hypothetical protein